MLTAAKVDSMLSQFGAPLVSDGVSPHPPTLGTLIGLRHGTKMPGLLSLLKGDCPVSEIVTATQSWAAHCVREAITEAPLMAFMESPSVSLEGSDLPPPPADPCLLEDGTGYSVSTPIPDAVVLSHDAPAPFNYDGIWDTADLNNGVAEGPTTRFDTLRGGEPRWYEPRLVGERVSAGGFPENCPGRPHIDSVQQRSPHLSCGHYMGKVSMDVRAMMALNYDVVYGYALMNSVTIESGSSEQMFAAGRFASEAGLELCDATETVNAWAPFGYVEAIPYTNLRWGSKVPIHSLLLEGLVLVRVSTTRSNGLLTGTHGACMEVLISKVNDAGNVLPGSAVIGASISPAPDVTVGSAPHDPLVPTVIIPPDLTCESVLSVDIGRGWINLIREGWVWTVDGRTTLPGGRYKVYHTPLPESEGRIRLVVVDWISSPWVSASARMTYAAARDPLFCSIPRPAWAHVADPLEAQGRVLCGMACGVPQRGTFSMWREPAELAWILKHPGVTLTGDGIRGSQVAFVEYGRSFFASVFGTAKYLRENRGKDKGQWYMLALRQWLFLNGMLQGALAHTPFEVCMWNPLRPAQYFGLVGHLPTLVHTVVPGAPIDRACPFGGQCSVVPLAEPCLCSHPSDVDKTRLPVLTAAGRYERQLPLAGHHVYFALLGLEGGAGSRGVQAGHCGSWDRFGKGKYITPTYRPRPHFKDAIQAKFHLDGLVYLRRRRSHVKIANVTADAQKETSGHLAYVGSEVLFLTPSDVEAAVALGL